MSRRSAARLTFLEDLLHLGHRPIFRRWDYADAGFVCRGNKNMRTDLAFDMFGAKVGVRFPIQSDIEVAWENLPLRSVI